MMVPDKQSAATPQTTIPRSSHANSASGTLERRCLSETTHKIQVKERN